MGYVIFEDAGASNRPSTLPAGVWNQMESKARRYLNGFPGNLDQWHQETERIINGLLELEPHGKAMAWVVLNEWANHHAVNCWWYKELAQELRLWPHVEFTEEMGLWPWKERATKWDHEHGVAVDLAGQPEALELPPDPWFGSKYSRGHRIDL